MKAANTLSTYGTQFKASRNLALTAGDATNYYAVTDQKLETAKRNERTGWGIGGLFSITVSSGSYSNSLFQLSGQLTTLQSQLRGLAKNAEPRQHCRELGDAEFYEAEQILLWCSGWFERLGSSQGCELTVPLDIKSLGYQSTASYPT